MKNITLEQLESLAIARNLSLDVVREMAVAQGFNVVEPMVIDIEAELASLTKPAKQASKAKAPKVAAHIDNTMSMGDFADGMKDQALYDAMISLTKGTLYAIAKNTDSDFAPTAFYENDQWERMYADPESKWHKVIMASEAFNKSVKHGKDDSNNKARLIGAMIAYHRGVPVQDNAKAVKEAVARKTTRKAAKGTVKVNKVTKTTYVEAPSQAIAREKSNKITSDKDAQAVERYDQLSAFMQEADFTGFPFVETCLKGHLAHYAKVTGVTVDPYEAAWEAAVNADDYRKLAAKYARKGNVNKMAKLIVENRSNFKGLAFVHTAGIEVKSKHYKAFGDTNPLYAHLANHVAFLQEATKLANELQRKAA